MGGQMMQQVSGINLITYVSTQVHPIIFTFAHSRIVRNSHFRTVRRNGPQHSFVVGGFQRRGLLFLFSRAYLGH